MHALMQARDDFELNAIDNAEIDKADDSNVCANEVAINNFLAKKFNIEDFASEQFSYIMHKSGFSNEAPLSACNWFTTNMSIENFYSRIPFPIVPVWENGITKINVQALAQLGLNQARCQALHWGFDLGLSTMPIYQSHPPDNYSSLNNFGSLVQEKLSKDAAKGIIEIFTPDPNESYLFHPLGAVPKGESDCRIVVDTSATGLNDIILDSNMALPSLSSILNSIKKDWVACTYDLTGGRHHEIR